MKFINDLSKPIEDDPINYIPTQVVCEYFKKIYKMKNGEKINGIIYYSSKNPGGKCCALYIENKDCTENKNEKDKILWLDKNSIQIYKRSYIKL